MNTVCSVMQRSRCAKRMEKQNHRVDTTQPNMSSPTCSVDLIQKFYRLITNSMPAKIYSNVKITFHVMLIRPNLQNQVVLASLSFSTGLKGHSTLTMKPTRLFFWLLILLTMTHPKHKKSTLSIEKSYRYHPSS